MAIETNEPRALTAALNAPVFATRGAGLAMHVADRHVERWAPEASASRVRPMRNLSFVDRLVSPWIETAQRSASLRLFSQYHREGMAERSATDVSWVFPRPWYQDELSWMAAARQAPRPVDGTMPAPTMLTTRGTYVPPAASSVAMPREATALPAALYEYVAPSLSIASPTVTPGMGYGGNDAVGSHAAYSPLVSLAAVQAAELMSRAVAPMVAMGTSSSATIGAAPTAVPGRMSPALRNVLSTMLERAAIAREVSSTPSRISGEAPELVTPPAPRPDWHAPARADAEAAPLVGGVSTAGMSPSQAAAAQAEAVRAAEAMRLAQQYAEQRAKIVEVQRLAQKAAERELAARMEATRAERAATTPAGTTTSTTTDAASTDAVRTDEMRAIAARAEAGRQRAASARAEAQAQAQTAQSEEQRRQLDAANAERTRIEERIAQRMAERQRTVAESQRTSNEAQRARSLHEQARIEAAIHARELQSLPTTTSVSAPSTVVEQRPAAMPAEVAAAFAALPPEIASYLGQRPDQALRAIDELADAMRTVELMARTTAAGGSFAATRGPRLMMPAGLGGLVATVDRAHAIAHTMSPATQLAQFAAAGQQAPLAPLRIGADRPGALSPSTRVPNLTFLRPEAVSTTRTEAGAARLDARTAPTSTFGAISAAAPAALDHVAWADRWLARFAGASQQSLDTFSASAGSTSRLQSLVAEAPGGVFVAPMFDVERDGDRVRIDSSGHVSIAPSRSAFATTLARAAAAAPSTTSFVAPSPMTDTAAYGTAATATPMRFADDAETPDDVFAAISAAASRGRVTAATAPASAAAATAAGVSPATTYAAFDRTTTADLVAHAAPTAPGAGFAAQLASSPFAPALRHVLPMASAATFDVRALFGSNISTTYLAGLLATGSEEVELAAPTMPAWASWGQAAFPTVGGALEREAPSFDAAYVSPELPAGISAAELAELAQVEGGAPATPSGAEAAMAPLTTLRTALLSWNLDAAMLDASSPTASFAALPAIAPSITTSATSQPITTSAARAMIEAMSMPLLDDTFHPLAATSPFDTGPAFAAPGMIGARAQSWSVAQERSSSDLALDFVTPELVLAARVYGLGPAEAAQAARLAIAGPGPLGAMASTVDRTFVQAMQIESDRRGALTAYPVTSDRGVGAIPGMPGAPSTSATAGAGVAGGAGATAGTDAAPTTETMRSLVGTPSGMAFGVDRRAPRGAFLWPAATVAALGLHAAGPDSEQSMSVAALELLAAQAVAELGTFAALGPAYAPTAAAADDETVYTSAADVRGEAARSSLVASGAAAMGAGASTATAGAPGSEPSERDVLDAAVTLVPSSRRARFEALYVALGQSATTSPAARAAKALALAGRGEETLSARERASLAWDVLPVVYASAADGRAVGPDGRVVDMDAEDANSPEFAASRMPVVASRGVATPTTRSGRDARGGFAGFGDTTYVDADLRPGLGSLSARAGEALGSYVAPVDNSRSETSSASSSSSSSSREVGAVLRAPTAAQELVRTGRPSGRFGGGEVEIPTWFEAAARKMLEERSGASDGISLAELTLVTAAPTTQVAASSRAVPSASAPLSPGMGTSKDAAAKAEPIDIEKIANEIYRHILTMMDAARERNGEPYL